MERRKKGIPRRGYRGTARMMIIVQDNYQDPPSQRQWHVGEPFPDLVRRSVTIEADGHELQWLRVAISAGMAEANLDYRKTVWGVSE